MLIRKTYILFYTYQDLKEIDIWKCDLPEFNYTRKVSNNFVFNGFNWYNSYYYTPKTNIMKYKESLRR